MFANWKLLKGVAVLANIDGIVAVGHMEGVTSGL
jgi:hypothetical protein